MVLIRRKEFVPFKIDWEKRRWLSKQFFARKISFIKWTSDLKWLMMNWEFIYFFEFFSNIACRVPSVQCQMPHVVEIFHFLCSFFLWILILKSEMMELFCVHKEIIHSIVYTFKWSKYSLSVFTEFAHQNSIWSRCNFNEGNFHSYSESCYFIGDWRQYNLESIRYWICNHAFDKQKTIRSPCKCMKEKQWKLHLFPRAMESCAEIFSRR